MQKIKLATYNHRLVLGLVLILSFSHCSKDPGRIPIVSPVPPDLTIYIFDKTDSVSIFESLSDSIKVVLPPPHQNKPTFAKIDDFGPNTDGIYLECGMLVTYSALDSIKTSLLFYKDNPIPDTLMVDYYGQPNPRGFKDHDYIPIRLSLNGVEGVYGKIKGSWLVYR